MAALVPGVVLEKRRKQPLVLTPAMGVHLTHHSRDHYIVEHTTKVVSDRHHGGIRLEYRFNQVIATSGGSPGRRDSGVFFRRGGLTIPNRTEPDISAATPIKVDPYSHGVIISSPSFAADYKLRIPSTHLWNPSVKICGDPNHTLKSSFIMEKASKPFLLRSASPLIMGPSEDWQSSDDGDAYADEDLGELYMPKPGSATPGGSALSWESRSADKTCDRLVPTIKRDASPIFVGKRSEGPKDSESRITGMAFGSRFIAELEFECGYLALRLSRCYLTWDSLHAIANRDGTVARRPVLEYHFVYVLDDGRPPSTVMDASTSSSGFVEGEDVRCVVTYMISENDDACDLPLLDVLFGTPKFLEQVERQCSTRDTEREVSARSGISIGEFCQSIIAQDLPLLAQDSEVGIFETEMLEQLPTLQSGSKLVKLTSSLSKSPINLARSFSGKLARQLSAEESHGVWRTIQQWDLEYDFKTGSTPNGLYSLMNHEFTFLHYTDHQHRPIDWFVADIAAPSSQIDALVRPIVNLRQRPYTVNRDELLGIAHFDFKE